MSTATASLRRVATLVVAGCFTLAACGDDSSSDTTEPASAATSPAADAVTIEIDVDSAVGSPGTETVPLGSPVTLHIVSSESHEFHVHGYDIEDEGTDLTISFVAGEAGEFEVETHDTEELVFTLVVEG